MQCGPGQEEHDQLAVEEYERMHKCFTSIADKLFKVRYLLFVADFLVQVLVLIFLLTLPLVAADLCAPSL